MNRFAGALLVVLVLLTWVGMQQNRARWLHASNEVASLKAAVEVERQINSAWMSPEWTFDVDSPIPSRGGDDWLASIQAVDRRAAWRTCQGQGERAVRRFGSLCSAVPTQQTQRTSLVHHTTNGVVRDVAWLAILVGVAALFLREQERFLKRRATERADQASREALLQRLSHELRTPVAAVQSLGHALRTSQGAQREQFVGLLEGEVERLTTGINQLLAAARGSLGRAPALSATNLGEWAREVQARWYVRIPELTLRLTEQVQAKVDVGFLDEAVDALLDNALKYGDIPICLEVGQEQGEVVIVVEDCGPGVPREQWARVFERLARIETGWGDAGGHGIGLWSVAEVARAHGGTAALEGPARFVIRLPCEEPS